MKKHKSISKSMRNELRAMGLLLVAMAIPVSLQAQWNDWLGGDGDWMEGNNWSEGTPPDDTEYAGFRGSGVSNVNLDVSQLVGRFYVWDDSVLNLTLGSGVGLATDTSFFATRGGAEANISGPASGDMATFTVGTGEQALVLNGPSAMTFSGPLLTLNASLNVGRQGDDGTFRMENGVVVNSANFSTGNVGSREGGNDLHIEVDGAGTVLNVEGDSNIPINIASRPRADGSATNFQENNSLTISNGAQVFMNSTREPGLSPAGVDIGHGDFYKRDNWIEVTGSGSLLEIRGDSIVTRIGRPDSGSNYNNYMLVEDGGVIQTEGATEINNVIADTSGEMKNRLVIEEGSSYITSNTIDVDGGMIQLAEDGQIVGKNFDEQSVAVDVNITGIEDSLGRLEAAGTGLGSSVTANINEHGVLAVGLQGDTAASVLTLGSIANMNHGSTLELTIFGSESMDSIEFLSGAGLNLASDTEGDGVTLSVLLDDYDPGVGEIFSAFTGETSSIVNSFAEIDLPALSGGLEWDTGSFNESGGWELSVIPEPGTYGLFLGLGILAMLAFRRLRTSEED